MKPLLTVILLGLLVCGAAADSVVLQPGPGSARDVFIWSLSPDDNYESGELYIGYYEPTGTQAGLIQFDGINDALFDNCEINSAILGLYPTPAGAYGTLPLSLVFVTCLEAWEPDTVTWNTVPSVDNAYAFNTYITQETDWSYIDITDYVIAWVENGYPNHGFLFGPSTYEETGIRFYHGEESTYPSYRPKLTVVYTPDAAVEHLSWGEIKALD